MKSDINKKILILGPALAQRTEIDAISNAFSFLNSEYRIDLFDSLDCIYNNMNYNDFLIFWRKKINQIYHQYTAFIGLSLGGIILQQCFDILEQSNKKVILCSTPAFVEGILKERLSHIIKLISQQSLMDALIDLNKHVSYPNSPPLLVKIVDEKLSTLRLSHGLQFVVNIDSRAALAKTKVNHLHLIGEKSSLVGQADVFLSKQSELVVVPNAGMRVLENNPLFCSSMILQFLNGRYK